MIPIYVIYDNPTDHPGKFVVRKWWGDKPTGEGAVTDSLYAARLYIRELGLGLVMVTRDPGDDPCIVESWL